MVGQYCERASAIYGAGRHVVLEIFFDVLVVDVELLFQRIQLGLVEDLPPVAADHRVLRAGHLPALGVLEVDRRLFVVGRGDCRRRGRMIRRPDAAAAEQDEQTERAGGK